MRLLIFICLNLVIFCVQAQVAIPSAALDKLVQAGIDSHSTSLAVATKDKVLLEKTFSPDQGLAPAHSVLKSIAALAVGRLIGEGRIDSAGQAVHEFYPEWKQGLKRKVTIRHLLNHTSGMACEDPDDHYFAADDVVQHALSTDMADTPGTRFVYNSKAFLLLLGIIEKASGVKPDRYFEQAFFSPLGIRRFSWEYDRAGNLTGLSTHAAELVKIGQLMLFRGSWKGKELVPRDWISQVLQPSQNFARDCGLLWWLIPETTHYILDEQLLDAFLKAGVKPAFVEKMRLLKGEYVNVNIPPDKLAAVFGPDWPAVLDKELYPYVPGRTRRVFGSRLAGYKAEGYLGQYLVVYPEKGIVAARMIRHTPAYNPVTDELLDFQKLVYRLTD